MGLFKALRNFSPAAGAISGKGLLGKGMAKFEDATGMGGLFPKMAQAARNKDMRNAAMAAEMQRDADMRDKGRAIASRLAPETQQNAMKKGGKVKKMAKGGSTASKRADGCAVKGKTKGRFV